MPRTDCEADSTTPDEAPPRIAFLYLDGMLTSVPSPVPLCNGDPEDC